MQDSEAIQKVLTMPRELRIRVVEQLLAGLDDEQNFDIPQQIIDDCHRISADIKAGAMQTHSWDEVKARFEALRRA